MDDVAARAGVSRAAVSLAMRRSPKISAKRTEEILRVARDLGYRPNLIASRLAKGDVATFGVLLADLHNPIMADFLDGFAPSAMDGGYEMYLASGFNTAEGERKAVESFLAHRLKGVVLVGTRLDGDEIRSLATSIPTVVVGRGIEGVDCVLVDDESGARLVAEHFLNLGCRRLAHIDGGEGAGADIRKAAFLEICRRRPEVSVRIASGDYSQASGYRGARVLFTEGERPAALFAANDLMALGALGAARELGLVAGADFSLCGFDDLAASAFAYVSLTSVSYSREKIGGIARRLLKLRREDPERPTDLVKLQPHLVIRGTSRLID
jgi:DNA-binding LacI/PurR family transcriptional regulator